MLELKVIRAHKERVIEGLVKKNFKEVGLVDEIIEQDDNRKALQQQLDDVLAKSNSASKQIGGLFKQGKRDEANAMKASIEGLKGEAKTLKEALETAKSALHELLVQLPNIPHTSVPAGTSDEDNDIFQAWEGDLPNLGEDAKPHWELAKTYGLFDLELGVKITGAGFPLYRGKGAKLERALINFFLDEGEKAGYEEIVPPLLINAESAFGTGQLPDKEGQMYYAEKDDLYLLPTAEIPITNIYRDEIIEEKQLPIKLTGYTPCFRREAGSYGAHVRGLNRVHQFDKVEIVQITHPDKSYETLHDMLNHVRGLLDKLGLPYRILTLCGGDVSFASALTYDFEVYSAAQKRWLEVSSVSNFETFQSNRMKLRFRNEKRKTELCHTLNGSALALARIVAAIIENYQTPEGIVIPEALRPYTRFDIIK
ncbi:MAG: serine--tRNA ligase [Saprospiraceae bacterium]